MKTAIVMGGSMAGLLAARVLTDHFDQVTIVERDEFPSGPENRRGAPQGRHTHGLLAGGREQIERMLPGITDELIRAGAIAGDISRDSFWFFQGGPLARETSGMQALAMSRPFFESNVRRRVLALPKVRSRQACQVEGLTTVTESGRVRVTGVQLAGEALQADFVVDATGRGSRSPQWLIDLGYTAPAEERIEVSLGYTTRFFRRDPRDLDGKFAAVIPPTPQGKRGGVMIAQEGGRWTVTLISHFGKSAPEDVPGFLEFAKSLPAPYIYDTVRSAEPIGESAGAKMPAAIRRRYEKLQRFPDNYLVIGDAICSFNPIYGQGMTVASQEARVLGEVLSESPKDPALRFFARASKVVDNPWVIATGNDLQMPEASGPKPPGTDLVNWYMAKLHRAAHHDATLANAFHRVANLLDPPPSLMHPRNSLRVLKSSLGRASRATHTASQTTVAAR